MRKNIILTLILTSLLLTMLLISGCDDKKSTNVEEVLDKDCVNVMLIDNWDLWEMQGGSIAAGNSPVAVRSSGVSRDGEIYPALVEELYAVITPHVITINGVTYDSSLDEVESIHLENNQLWIEDADEIPAYYYDYFYNENSGALWLRAETTADTVWNVDPLSVDTLGVAMYNPDDFILMFPYGKGPNLALIQPENDWIVPDPENGDIDDLTPKFKWSQYIGEGEEYTFQLRNDENFEETTGFVYNEIVTEDPEFTIPAELDNFESYFWRVKASISDWSEIWTFITKEVVLLAAPTDNSYLGLKPTFSWDDLNGASEYTIQITEDVNFETGIIEATVAATSYVPAENLDANAEYFWRVSGNNSVSNGDTYWSDIWSFTADQSVKMNAASPSDEATEVVLPVDISWNNLANTNVYHLQVATDSLFADKVIDENNIATNSFTDSGVLNVNIEYFWRVNSDVAVDWSDTLSFKTNTVVLLNSPENDAVDQSVLLKLKWEKYNSTSTVYTVQVADNDAFTNPIVDSYITYDGDEIQCETASIIEENDDDDLIEFIAELPDDFAASTMYYWRVQRDSLEWSNTWNFTTAELDIPVMLVDPVNDAVNVELLPKLKWTTDSGVDYYRVLVSLDPTLADTLWLNKVVDTNNHTLLELDDEMLLAGETYYWKARSDESGWSDIWSFTVRSGIPYDITVNGDEVGFNLAATPNKNDLSWNCLDGPHDAYLIERSLGAGNTDWTQIDSLGANVEDYADLGLDQNTVYNYRLRTNYLLGYSDYSPVVTVTTKTFVLENNPALVAVTSGNFTMGNNSGEADEAPEHSVTLTNDFELGKYEITNTEFCELLNWALGKGFIKSINQFGSSSAFATGAYNLDQIIVEDQSFMAYSTTANIFKIEENKENHPAAGITYYGAANYCNWLGEVSNTNALYTGTSSLDCTVYGTAGYRLPTEAEWEFAATNRGASTTIYSGSDDVSVVAWHIGNATNSDHPVGEKAANSLNMFDMSGNVWEWCNDIYGDYSAGSITDPIGAGGSAGSNSNAVIRGGSWEYSESYLRNTNRSYGLVNLSSKVNTAVGFRIVKID